jgi:hypothetical protein
MRTLLLVTSLCVLPLSACLPLYMAGARMAVSTVAVVASGVTAAGTPTGPQVPQERAALLEAYVSCVKQREKTPGIDCTRYRTAVEATTP